MLCLSELIIGCGLIGLICSVGEATLIFFLFFILFIYFLKEDLPVALADLDLFM